MPIAAVPDYLGTDFSTASPGMRFGMYLQVWTPSFSKVNEKVEPLQRAGKLNDNDKAFLHALILRQKYQFDLVVPEDQGMILDAQSIAPFSTGLGNEHPLENGFSFLNPYGLPYLPGSGVKGVLRQSARELASGDWGDNQGWSEEAITILFGQDDDQSEPLRGALIFWDVIPRLKGDKLTVEIMTPHQKHYYQDGDNPHESGMPVPITFLAVPPGSEFLFHVQCDLKHLERHAAHLLHESHWKNLLQSAFRHAFTWLGFGAKTAVGYGAMIDRKQIEETQRRQQEERLEEAGISVASNTWEQAQVVSFNPGSGEIKAKSSDGKLASGNVYSQLSDASKKRLKKKKPVHVDVDVEEKGNSIQITSIRERDEKTELKL